MSQAIKFDGIATIRNANHDLVAEGIAPVKATGKSYFDGEALWHEAASDDHGYGWFTLGHPEHRAPGERALCAPSLEEIADVAN